MIFTQEITDETVGFLADAAVHHTVLGLGPEVYYRAIAEALASGERLDGLNQVPQFDQEQVAEFLRSLAARLDELRPWPELKFRRLDDPAAWARFEPGVPIARLEAPVLELTTFLQGVFRPVGDHPHKTEVLMLELQTGDTVALLGSHGRGEKVTLLTDAAGDPAEVIEHFTAATGFPADKVIRI